MMKKQTVLLMALCLIIIVSCKKSGNDPAPYNTPLFIIGDPTTIGTLVVLDPVTTVSSWGNGGLVSGGIDVSGDGTDDITFECFGQKWASTRSSGMSAVNGVLEILAAAVYDTLYHTTNNLNPLVDCDDLYYNSFSGFDSYQPDDEAIRTDVHHYPNQHLPGDTIRFDDPGNLWSGDCLLSDHSQGKTYAGECFYIRRGIWSGAGDRYVVFRLKNSMDTTYGWIKMRVEYDYSVTVSEYALQN